ncbi:hypothetical protein JI723_13845 [Providencia manganoxydans]|uniref:Lipoprotein n=2 Tax=Providencia TaxID=586 RepID=A0AAI9GHU6_PROST|nr:hypothetical protein [Providencia stuartii]QQO61350.1 hypothetical protein JI723_13845 [Providencia manganoxydans]
MKKTLLAVVIGAFIVVGCGQKELSPLEIEQVNNLKSELAATEKSISSAKLDQEKYTGGLIKSLIQTRAEVLETNKALLQQRINAIESGAKIDIVIEGARENPELAKQLEDEIINIEKEIEAGRKEAANYTGGLVLSMKLASIATQEQTVAMLQQKYLSAKYGISDPYAPRATNNKDTLKQQNDDDKNTEQVDATKIDEPLLPPESGPLGLKMGLTKQNIEDMTGEKLDPIEDSPNLYIIKNTPKRNPSFDTFGLVVSPTVGLCQIRAIGKPSKNNSYGVPIRDEFDSLNESLVSLYGKNNKIDKLLPGSIWKQPQEWMTALALKERILASEWAKPSEEMKKVNLSSIILQARGEGRTEGYLFLQYSFDNEKECFNEIENMNKSSL